MGKNVQMLKSRSKMSRRRFIRDVSASMLTLSLLGGAECTPDQIDAIIELAVLLAKVAFTLAEEITGEVAFENIGNSVEYVAGVVCLIRKGADGEDVIKEIEAYFEVPPGESSVPFGDLFAQEAGKHQVEVQTGIGTWCSDTFQVS